MKLVKNMLTAVAVLGMGVSSVAFSQDQLDQDDGAQISAPKEVVIVAADDKSEVNVYSLDKKLTEKELAAVTSSDKSEEEKKAAQEKAGVKKIADSKLAKVDQLDQDSSTEAFRHHYRGGWYGPIYVNPYVYSAPIYYAQPYYAQPVYYSAPAYYTGGTFYYAPYGYAAPYRPYNYSYSYSYGGFSYSYYRW